MNNKQDTYNCFVFSQATLDLALQEWLALEIEKNPEQEEALLIAAAALPWFLKYLKQTAPIFMFTYDILIAEMSEWQLSQIADYPHQQQRIESTCEQLLSFFDSELVLQHKMMIHA